MSTPSGETALWRAVIAQSLDDLVTVSDSAATRRNREDAETWIFTSRDFDRVCGFAEVAPHQVRALARKMLDARAAGENPREIINPKLVPQPKPVERHQLAGEEHTIEEWAEIKGLSVQLIRKRLNDGWGLELALNTPKGRPSRAGQPGFNRTARPGPVEQTYTHNGVTRTLTEWARSAGVCKATIRRRLKAGNSFAQALRPSRQGGSRNNVRMLEHAGTTLSMTEWAKRLGISQSAMSKRLASGWTIERALTEPFNERTKRPPREKRAPAAPRQRPSVRKAPLITLEHDGQVLTIRQWADKLDLTYEAIRARMSAGLPVDQVLQPGALPTGRIFEHDGQALTLAQWADKLGVSASTLRVRLRKRWTLADALTTPAQTPDARAALHEHDGRALTIAQWATEVGIDVEVIRMRLQKRWTLARALTTPARAWTRKADRGEGRGLSDRGAGTGGGATHEIASNWSFSE